VVNVGGSCYAIISGGIEGQAGLNSNVFYSHHGCYTRKALVISENTCLIFGVGDENIAM
jgi:hypothetical protein